MKIWRILEGVSSFGICGEKVIIASPDVLLMPGWRFNLSLYGGGYQNILVLHHCTVSADRLEDDRGSQIFKVSGLSCVEVGHESLEMGSKISYFDSRFMHIYESSKCGLPASKFIDTTERRECRLEEPGRRLCLYSDGIVAWHGHEIIHYTWSGDVKWRFGVGDFSVQYSPNPMAYLKDNCFLFNEGQREDGSGAIVCLSSDDGSIVWRREFSTRVENSYVIDGRIYVAVQKWLGILSASDGSVLKEISADFKKNERSCFWSDGRLLYAWGVESNKIIAYTQDGKVIDEYTLPDHPVIGPRAKVFTHEGVNYLSLSRGNGSLAGVEGGVLVWTADEVLNGCELEVEGPDAVSTIVAGNEEKGLTYNIIIAYEDIHNVIRFGEIEARKVASLRGSQIWDDNVATHDRDFNGKIALAIDPAVGKENAVYLDELVRRVESFAEIMKIRSGDGKSPIRVSWSFQDEL